MEAAQGGDGVEAAARARGANDVGAGQRRLEKLDARASRRDTRVLRRRGRSARGQWDLDLVHDRFP